MAHLKKTLPREGTVCLAGGESLTESSDSVCPTVSGGGKDCHEASRLVPLVVMERVETGRSRSPLKGENARETRAQRRRREVTESPVPSGSSAVASRASSAASGGAFFERPSMGMQTPMYLSDSGSSTTTTDGTKFLRTRKRNQGTGSGSTSDTPKPQRKAAKKIKGAAGGLTEAQQQQNIEKRDALQRDLEEKMSDKERQNRMAKAKTGYGVSGINLEDRTMPELVRLAGEHMEDVAEIASKCSNIKGTLQKALKDRAAAMLGVVAEFACRNTNEETARLQATVDNLQAKCDTLERRVAELLACRDRPAASTHAMEAEPSPPEAPPSSWESSLRKMLQEERAFTRACFAGIEDRLLPEKRLRPPLAADAKRSAAPSANGAKTTGPSQPPPKTAPSRTSRAATAVPSPSQADASLPSTTPANEWSTVVRRGRARRTRAATPAARAPAPPVPGPAGKNKKAPKKTSAAPGPAKKATAAKKQRLVSPKTAAVVVTLTTEAADKGETYATLLKRARAVINPSALGLEKVRCRQTQTGARMFEFPGAQGGSNADTFAGKLREAVADLAKVVRPTKCSSLLVTELDDSVTKDEVLAAVAEIGGCAAAAIKAGEVRPGRGGMGTIRLQCPVTAAKAVVAKGRVLVGFSSGVVRVLEEQPMRCFKCFGIGHTRPRCPSSADRADSCYRCGEAGHKAASCSSKKAHCAVCAEAGRPSGHLMSGRRCMPPPKKGKEKAKAQPKSPAVQGGAMSE